MKIAEWVSQALDPPIGAIEHWLADILGAATAEEDACLVLPTSDGARVLIATDVGLFDCYWAETPHRLTGELSLWSDVLGMQLRVEASVGPDLARRPLEWSMVAESPKLATEGVSDVTGSSVMLVFWQACRKSMDGAR